MTSKYDYFPVKTSSTDTSHSRWQHECLLLHTACKETDKDRKPILKKTHSS